MAGFRLALVALVTTAHSLAVLGPSHVASRPAVRAARLARRSIVTAASDAPWAERVKLGDSDLHVSKCCLGTMTWGEQNTQAEGVEQLFMGCDEMGLNFIDTAEMYPVPTKAETQGATDKTVAEWLRRRGKRDDIVLASKVSGYSDRINWLRKSGEGSRVNREQIIESVDSSLKRLGTDYIDLLQIHWPDRYVPLFGSGKYDASQEREAVPFVEQLQALKKLVDQGKVR